MDLVKLSMDLTLDLGNVLLLNSDFLSSTTWFSVVPHKLPGQCSPIPGQRVLSGENLE